KHDQALGRAVVIVVVSQLAQIVQRAAGEHLQDGVKAANGGRAKHTSVKNITAAGRGDPAPPERPPIVARLPSLAGGVATCRMDLPLATAESSSGCKVIVGGQRG